MQKKNQLKYQTEKQDASTRVARWNACQLLCSRLYHSEINTEDLLRISDETPTTKTLGFVQRRIASN